MSTEEQQRLNVSSATHNISGFNTDSQPDPGPSSEVVEQQSFPQQIKIYFLYLVIAILVAVIIIIVLCGVYTGLFDAYAQCQCQCECDATFTLSQWPGEDADHNNSATDTVFSDGNEYDFDHDVCVGFRDIWEDPAIELSQRNQIGRAVWQTPRKIEQAINSIRYGKVYKLAYPYSRHMPLAFGRYFNTTLICGHYPEWNAGSCTLQLNTNAIGNVGTQFDSFGHFFGAETGGNSSNETTVAANISNSDFVLFNNFKGSDVFTHLLSANDDGVRYLGVEQLPTFFTRAILVDVAGYKNVSRLSARYVITVGDVLNTLDAQSLSMEDITQGDVVLFYTGWSELIDSDPILFYDWDATPGIGEAVITELLFRTNISVVGSDTWGVDALGANEFGAHHFHLKCGGGFIHESLNLKEWVMHARMSVSPWIGAYVFQPLPVVGGVASPGNPVVIV